MERAHCFGDHRPRVLSYASPTLTTEAPTCELSFRRFERGSFFLFDPASWEVVRKDNFTVMFDQLERAPALTARTAGAAAAPGAAAPPPAAAGAAGGAAASAVAAK